MRGGKQYAREREWQAEGLPSTGQEACPTGLSTPVESLNLS